MVEIKGIKELQRKFDSLTDAKEVAILKTVFSRAAKPARTAAKAEAPKEQNDETIARYQKGRIVAFYEPGNLKKSMAIFKGKSRKFPKVEVGAKAGTKHKYDGWYAHFVHEGHKTRGGGFSPKDEFMKRALLKTESKVNSQILIEYNKRLKQKFG